MKNNDLEILLKEADVAVTNKNWTIATSSCPSLFNKKNLLNYLLFQFSPTIGIAMAISRTVNKKKKEKEAKELAYKQIILKQNAVIKALQSEANADKERIDSLTQLNALLTDIAKKLKEELYEQV